MGGRSTVSKTAKENLTRQHARSFDKESHAKGLVQGLARKSADEADLKKRLMAAESVVSAVREKGVTSFYSAEYAKVFDEPEEACSAREGLMATFVSEHGLTERRAAKMADCIVFSTAKKGDKSLMQRIADVSSEALGAGVPFNVVADVTYYNPPDVSAERYARRCVETSLKQNKALSVSEVELANRISAVV